MTMFFCPSCWETLEEDQDPCLHCGCKVSDYLQAKSYTQRLIEALNHPEPETPVRAAYILGVRRDREAMPFLVAKAESTKDVYLAMTCLDALARIGGQDAVKGISRFCTDPRVMVSRRANDLLAGLGDTAFDSPGGAG